MRRPSVKKAAIVAGCIVIAGGAIRLLSWIQFVGPVVALNGADAAMQAIYSEFIYYPSYTRLDGLLVGVTLAAIMVFRPGWWALAMQRGHSLEFAGFALVSCAVWLFAERVSLGANVFGFPILSAGLGLLLASSVSANGVLARVRIPGAAALAVLAYSLYLTHKVVMHLDRLLLADWLPLEGIAGLPIFYVSCCAVAAALNLLIEQPFLRLRERLTARPPPLADHPPAAVIAPAQVAASRGRQPPCSLAADTATQWTPPAEPQTASDTGSH
jgi:peptidoglycan/LPS O-acetylase OafA/YrhL